MSDTSAVGLPRRSLVNSMFRKGKNRTDSGFPPGSVSSGKTSWGKGLNSRGRGRCPPLSLPRLPLHTRRREKCVYGREFPLARGPVSDTCGYLFPEHGPPVLLPSPVLHHVNPRPPGGSFLVVQSCSDRKVSCIRSHNGR